MIRTLAALLLSALIAPALARGAGSSVTGVVARVVDGDTFWLRVHGKADKTVSAPPARPIKVRLLGIDAPEHCQAWGPESKAALEARILNRQVTLRVRSADDYRRSLATLEVDGDDVGAWMVARGHAWSARFHRSLGAYAAEERAARSARRGLFAQAGAVEPRAFRKAHGPCP